MGFSVFMLEKESLNYQKLKEKEDDKVILSNCCSVSLKA